MESAWSYRFQARQTAHLKRKAKVLQMMQKPPPGGRYRTLTQAGKNIKLVCVAIARELVGFFCDIVCHEMPKLQQAIRQVQP